MFDTINEIYEPAHGGHACHALYSAEIPKDTTGFCIYEVDIAPDGCTSTAWSSREGKHLCNRETPIYTLTFGDFETMVEKEANGNPYVGHITTNEGIRIGISGNGYDKLYLTK